MSSRSASALLDAALAVPFDPEEEDRRQLALARSASWDSGPVSPSVVDIAPEPAFVPDPLVQAADQQMQRTAEPAVPTGEYMEPPLPQADEDLPPVSQPGAGGMEQGVTRQGGGRRSASALLAEVLPEATAAEQRTAGPAVPTGGPRRRSAAALLAEIPEDSGVLRRAADVPIFIAQGITTGLKGLTDAFGADNAASQALASNQDFYQAQLSPEAQASQQRVAQIQAAAADQGVMAQLGAAGRAFAESPTAFVAQGVGTMAPTIALGAAGKAVGLGARGVQAVQTATGATMGGGIVKGEIYQAVEQAMLQAGRSPEEAAEAASTAQAYGGENLDQILAGYGLGALATAIGAERLAGRAIAGAAAPTGGVLRVAGRTALQEALPEAAQGGQEQLARNLAQQREDFNVPTMRGVVGAGALEGLAGLAIGGPAGVAAGVGAAAGRRTAGPAVPTGEAAAAAAAPAPVRRVVVEADDVFGEATTAAVEEPVAAAAAGDERFAPAPAAEPVTETAGAGDGAATAGTTASVPMMITRQMEADLLARGITQQEINRLTPQQAQDILAGAGTRTAGPAVPTGETAGAGDGAATAEPRTDAVQNRTNLVQNRTNAGQTVTNRVETATNAGATAEPTVKPPKKLYRGEAPNQWDPNVRGMGTFALGKGLYSSTDKKFAGMYGEVKQVSPDEYWPRNPLVLPGTGDAAGLLATYIARNTNFRNMREFNAAYPDPGQFVREQGFDGIIAGNEVVKYVDEAPAAGAAETAAATGETTSGVDEAANQNYGGINEVGISENASRGDAASPLESAASFTRSRAEAIRAASPSRKEFAAEFEALLEWGQREGLVTDQAPVQGAAASKGREHEVWLGAEGRVLKATYPQQFGLALSRDGKATPVQYLERIALNNEFFGDAIRIERLWNENGRLRVVTSQPFVNGRSATDQEIESFFNDLGFTKQRRGDREFFYNQAEGVVAFDTHGGNVLNVDGKVIPIDVGMQRVTPELAAALDLPAAATADAPAAAATAKRNIQRKLRPDSGAIDLSIVEDIVEYGKTVYRAGMDLATWSAQMVREFGQGVAQFLRQAFDRIVAAYRDSRFADTTGAVGDVRPRQTKPRQLEEKAMRNEALAAETRARLGSEYLPISLNAQAEAAKEWINTNGLDAAKLRIAQLSGEDSVPTPLDFAIGIEAAGRLSAVGDHQGAADIVSTMSHRATGMGQTISTLAMMARLSPEGIVFYGENIIKRYINALPPEAQDRIRALQAEVARLKAELAQAKFDQGSEVIRSGKLGDEKIQDRIKRRQRAKVEADLGPAASGPEVTAETRARVISMNRAVRDVLLGDATRAEATKAIEAILLEQGNLSAAEAAAMARSIADAFFKLMRETRTRLTNEARTKALPTKARGFEKLLELLRSGKDVSDAEFTGNVAQLLGLPGMTPAMARELRALAQRYERATDPDVKMVLGQMMFEKAHEIIPVEFFSKVRAFAYLAMLFSPKTWIKNFLGNQILWVAHIGRDAFISGIMDPAVTELRNIKIRLQNRSLPDGQKRPLANRTMSGAQVVTRMRALLTPIEDVRKGYLWNKQENPEANQWQNFMAGVNHLRVLSKLTSQNKFEIADVKNVGGRIFSSKFMRFFDTGLSIALGAGDRAFWMAEFRAKLAQMQAAAERNGEWSGQPTPEMIEAAMAEAAYAIFQNPNVLSQGLGEMRKWTNFLSTGGRSKELGLGTNLLTFTQVPGSITLRGVIDWSPLGFIGALYRGMRGILYASSTGRMGAKFDQAAFNKEFTQALLGTGTLYVAGYYLYALGIVSASREDDDDLEAMRRASGLGQYRINVTALRRALLSGNWFQRQEGQDGDYIVPYDWAQPLAITFAAGAELAAQAERTSREQLKKGGVKPQGMAATIFKLSGTKSLEELPLLSGLSSFMKAWGYGGPVDAVANTVAGMPAMFMPQVVRQWMQFQDNMQRETQAGDSVQREFMKVLATVPWYSKTFPLKFDTMGQAIERYQYGGNNVFNVLLNPTVAREVKMNPVMQEISRLVDATGETGMAPKKVDRTATINGEKVELTNNQIAAYQYYLGNFTMAHFTWRMAAPVYARLPDEVKAKMLTDDIQDIDAAVKSAVLGHDMRRLTRKQLFLRNALVNSPLGRSVPPR